MGNRCDGGGGGEGDERDGDERDGDERDEVDEKRIDTRAHQQNRVQLIFPPAKCDCKWRGHLPGTAKFSSSSFPYRPS
jgi:hypothetical protein